MLEAKTLSHLIDFVLRSHAESPTKPSRAVRKWDGRTPYGIHPTWCAMTILTETTLPDGLRVAGAQALLLHDILEDTTASLPPGTTADVATLVEGMTFESSDEEMRMVWSRSKEVRLLKLYDKVSNLLDGAWMSPEKRRRYADYLLRLCDDVEPVFGQLNIIRIARAIVS